MLVFLLCDSRHFYEQVLAFVLSKFDGKMQKKVSNVLLAMLTDCSVLRGDGRESTRAVDCGDAVVSSTQVLI
jgi:hypothetical protein